MGAQMPQKRFITYVLPSFWYQCAKFRVPLLYYEVNFWSTKSQTTNEMFSFSNFNKVIWLFFFFFFHVPSFLSFNKLVVKEILVSNTEDSENITPTWKPPPKKKKKGNWGRIKKRGDVIGFIHI